MKTKLQFLRWLMMLMLMSGALGAWAQFNQLPTQTVCVGAQPYYVDLVSGSTYQWTLSGGGSITSGQGTNSISVNWTTPSGLNPYILSVIRNDGNCDGPPQSVAVTVLPLPTPSVTGSNPVCVNGTYTYSTPASGNNFTWVISPNGVINSGQNTNSISVTWNSSGPSTVAVTERVPGALGCDVTNTLNVTTNDLPVPVATANTPCAGQTLTFTGAPAGMTTYAWSGPNGFTSNVQSPTIPNVTVAAAGVYTLTVTNASGCTASTTVDVTINALPVPVATANTPCAGQTLTFTGAPAGMTTYAWSGPNGFTSNVQSPTIPNVTVAAVGVYTLTVTNASGCTASTTVDVTINPLPNTSPIWHN